MTCPSVEIGLFTGGQDFQSFQDPQVAILDCVALFCAHLQRPMTVEQAEQLAALCVAALEHGGYPLSCIANGDVEIVKR